MDTKFRLAGSTSVRTCFHTPRFKCAFQVCMAVTETEGKRRKAELRTHIPQHGKESGLGLGQPFAPTVATCSFGFLFENDGLVVRSKFYNQRSSSRKLAWQPPPPQHATRHQKQRAA